VVDDWRSAPLSPKLLATLGFLEKLALSPDDVTSGDAEAVRAAGVSDEALRTASMVCALFSMIVRLADSLGWDVPPWERTRGRAAAMLAGGYSLGTESRRP